MDGNRTTEHGLNVWTASGTERIAGRRARARVLYARIETRLATAHDRDAVFVTRSMSQRLLTTIGPQQWGPRTVGPPLAGCERAWSTVRQACGGSANLAMAASMWA